MPRPGYDEVLLLTGYPSFAARKMLEHVLATEPRTLVILLVVAKLEGAAREHLATLDEAARARTEILDGDVAALDLGLSGAEIRRLAREVDRIHHMAHASYVGVDKKEAHLLNVVGTAEVLELARAASDLRCLVVHSTASVAGARTGTIYEDDLDEGQAFRNVVEETRMKAELLARRAMRDVPIAVVRPTSIVGDSGSGRIDRMDGLYLLVMLLVAMPGDLAIPFPGKGDAALNIVPIDFVVQAAHAIGKHPAARGRSFHLADPSPLGAREVFDLLARLGGKRASKGSIPANLAKALLRTPGVDRFLASPRAFVDELTHDVRYDTKNADQILAGTGIACPPLTSYLEVIVAAVQDRARDQKRQRELGRSDGESEIDDPLG